MEDGAPEEACGKRGEEVYGGGSGLGGPEEAELMAGEIEHAKGDVGEVDDRVNVEDDRRKVGKEEQQEVGGFEGEKVEEGKAEDAPERTRGAPRGRGGARV